MISYSFAGSLSEGVANLRARKCAVFLVPSVIEVSERVLINLCDCPAGGLVRSLGQVCSLLDSSGGPCSAVHVRQCLLKMEKDFRITRNFRNTGSEDTVTGDKQLEHLHIVSGRIKFEHQHLLECMRL